MDKITEYTRTDITEQASIRLAKSHYGASGIQKITITRDIINGLTNGFNLIVDGENQRFFNQHLDYFRMPVCSGIVKGRLAFIAAGGEIGAAVQQVHDKILESLFGSTDQRGVAMTILRVYAFHV